MLSRRIERRFVQATFTCRARSGRNRRASPNFITSSEIPCTSVLISVKNNVYVRISYGAARLNGRSTNSTASRGTATECANYGSEHSACWIDESCRDFALCAWLADYSSLRRRSGTTPRSRALAGKTAKEPGEMRLIGKTAAHGDLCQGRGCCQHQPLRPFDSPSH
jgi:hypothetical protein